MPCLFKIRELIVIVAIISSLLSVNGARAAMDPRFELDPQTLTSDKKAAKPQHVAKKRLSRIHSEHSASMPAAARMYTVKPGDHLFKILMRDYGLSNSDTELFIEEIKRENNIYDIKRLKVGQKISIPPIRRRADGSLNVHQAVLSDAAQTSASDTIPRQSFNLVSPVAALSGAEAVSKAHDVWNKIVPPKNEQQKPLTLRTPNFSLTLDPERYPTFARIDGGRIILDQNGTLPPLVKSLIEDKDASVRIVSEAPAGTKRFMGSLLEAAGFYSVEENFSLEFGVDPKITVHADFKVEKTAESLIKQDVVLVNSGRTALPPFLGAFLTKEGFSLYEPFASHSQTAQPEARSVQYISAKKQPEMVDTILSALSVSVDRNRSVDIFASDSNGISLAVKAERYFERGGKRYVVTSFDGDPISYTLFRILETKGYAVVILDAQDDFRKITDKLISRMKLNGSFAQHSILQSGSAGYSLQMSGFKLDDDLLPGGGVFLTDRNMDRIVRDLFTENGFTIKNR